MKINQKKDVIFGLGFLVVCCFGVLFLFQQVKQKTDQIAATIPTPTPTASPTPTITPTPTPSADAIYRYGKWHEPGTAGYYYELGFDYWRESKDWQNAQKYYKKALEVDPNYAPALSSSGYIKGAFEGDFAGGKKMLEKAMEIDPDWAYAPFNLGIIYTLNGNHTKGIEWIEYTIETYPDHGDMDHFKDTLKSMKDFYGVE